MKKTTNMYIIKIIDRLTKKTRISYLTENGNEFIDDLLKKTDYNLTSNNSYYDHCENISYLNNLLIIEGNYNPNGEIDNPLLDELDEKCLKLYMDRQLPTTPIDNIHPFIVWTTLTIIAISIVLGIHFIKLYI